VRAPSPDMDREDLSRVSLDVQSAVDGTSLIVATTTTLDVILSY
jgi:hypothetical protein